jgi:DNA-binding LytR/AlgR family response regulator
VIHIAIAEDDQGFRAQLEQFLTRYGQDHGVKFQVTAFADGADLLADDRLGYDVILLDIEMPRLNGMEAAERIRQKDSRVALVFLTNLAAYALRGFEVGAMDFILKPVSYETFDWKLGRVLKRVRRDEDKELLLPLPDGAKKLALGQIYYIEVQNRMLHYHTDQGEYVVRGTLQGAEEQLAPYPFAKCNHWYLVNLAHVSEVRKNLAIVAGHELEISRRNRTAFLQALSRYIGEAGPC